MSVRRTRVARSITLLTTTAAALALAAPAMAAPATAPSAELGMLVFHGDDIRGHYLECAPDGGTHPDARTACDKLREVDGNLLTLRPGSHPSCQEPESDPVDIEIMGRWNGMITVFNERYPNRACAKASAGMVVPIH
ncbi:SSI family serine proteinase inhibitor [Streptomyces sp. NPDC090442]|uniref:SSI family serine proteinase inhibitor n=1 Tax=Streptomyces sp. NPDC090442 TaxID=3365962 RepID=UPI00380FA358